MNCRGCYKHPFCLDSKGADDTCYEFKSKRIEIEKLENKGVKYGSQYNGNNIHDNI